MEKLFDPPVEMMVVDTLVDNGGMMPLENVVAVLVPTEKLLDLPVDVTLTPGVGAKLGEDKIEVIFKLELGVALGTGGTTPLSPVENVVAVLN
jgi:hypothetical protein